MTTGSWYINNKQTFGSGWIGNESTCSWNGADMPRTRGTAPTFYTVFREEQGPNGSKVVRYRVRRPGSRPPKRARNVDHAYTKSWTRLEAEAITLLNAGSTQSSNQVIPWGSWTIEDLFTPNDQIKLVNKLREKLTGSDFNLAVTLGESAESLRLLTDSARRIYAAMKALQRLDIYSAYREVFRGTQRYVKPRHDWRRTRTLRATADNVSALWLEASYGWIPLLKDAEEAAKSLAHHLNEPLAETYRTSLTKVKLHKVAWNHAGNYGGSFEGYKLHRRGIIARIRESPGVTISLGLMDPETVAWELFPFSFVADWFIPIGQWMSARAAASKLVGTFVTSDKKYAIAGPYKATFGMLPQSGSSKYRSMAFTRSVSSVLDVPMPSFKGWDSVLTWRHAFTAVALVVSRGRAQALF